MRIALCDDDCAILAFLSQRIQDYCDREHLAVELDCFSGGEELLASPHSYEIIFMDIYMAGMTGMEAARALASGKSCQIIFITTSREHAVEAFSLNAIHYLLKPLTTEGVEEALKRGLSHLREKPAKVIELKNGQGTVPVPLSGIVYVEVIDKISNVYTQRGVIRVYTPLDAICEQLDDSFLRVQRSFAVNMHFVESFLFDRVVLRGGVEITLSRSNRAALKTSYQQFLFQLARGNS